MAPKHHPHYEASLMVEAVDRSDIRSNYFKQTWARLFSAGDYYIDLAFEMKPESGELRGQVLQPHELNPSVKGKVKLYLDKQRLTETSLDESGTFVMTLKETGEHKMIFELERAVLTITAVDFY